MTVGDRIKQKRIELGYSQDELAKKVGYKSRSSIQKIECARNLPLPKVERMALALDCSPSYLMGWEDENNNPTTYGYLIEAYADREKKMELLAIYDNLSPEKKASFEAYLKFLQSES